MTNGYRTDSEKDSQELEREADQQRTQIEETITLLTQRFMPSQWLEQFVDYTRHSGGGDLGRSLVETVRANPIPSLLTATGLVWLLMGQRRQPAHEPYDDISDEPSRASYGVDPAYDPHAGEGHHGRDSEERGAHFHRLSDSAGRKAQHAGQQTRAGVDRLLHEQPLAIGVIGIALGALLGASMPSSRQEDEMLAPYKERLADKASGLAERAATKVDEVGHTVAAGIDPNNTTH